MNISQLSIRRGVTFAMLYIIAVGFGLYGLSQLKLDLYPSLEFPLIGIITNYEGVGPQDVENLVTRPIESSVVSVQGVKQITSQSNPGASILLVEFNWGTDMTKAEIDVRKNIDLYSDYLPDGVSKPITFAFNPAMQPMMFFNITSDKYGIAELRKIAEEQIQPRLERLPGVASINVNGGLVREIDVKIDPYRLAANNLSMDQVTNAIRYSNLEIPGGILEENSREFTVKTNAAYESIDQIANTVVGYSKTGQPIYLNHVATVEDGYKEEDMVVRNNEKDALVLIAFKQTDANTVQACENLVNYFPELRRELGNDIQFSIIFNQADFIRRSVSNLSSTAFLAFLLSGLVLLFFLRSFRSAFIVAASIPISIIVTFFVMSQMGLTLNIISMAGLALAVGMLVDNSIVVLENIFRRNHEVGEPIRLAAERGSREMSMAITASTLTTLSVFVPILFVPGISGQLFKDMALTIVVSLITSLAVALTLIPLAASRLLSKRQQQHRFKLGRIVDTGIGNMLDKMTNAYTRLLTWVLGHKKLTLLIVVGAFIISIISAKWIGGEFIPTADRGMIQLSVEASVGTSVSEMDRYMKKVEDRLTGQFPEIRNIYVSFGRQEGFGALFGSSASKGTIQLSLTDKETRDRSQQQIEDIIREEFQDIPGVTVSFSQNNPTSSEGALAVKVFGQDLDEGKLIAKQIVKIMEGIPGIVDVKASFDQPQPEYQIKIDRDRASRLGLNVTSVAQAVNTAIKGTVASQYRDGNDNIDILVRFDRPFRESENDLSSIFVTSPTGAQIPLLNVASVVPADGPVRIDREDQARYVSVNANISGRDLGSITKDLKKDLASISLPPDFRLEIGGSAQDMQESFMYLALAILVAIALVYMVMASQFESLLDPFIILFTIPLAFIGVIFALLVSGTNVGVTVFIGGMLLVGIVVNNGIVLIDYINQLIVENPELSLNEAIIEGGKTRLRPILMTALTTILSMAPLALEIGSSSEIWAPMARAVIGGLTASTFLTTIFIPIMYAFFQKKNIAKKRLALHHED